MTDCADVCRRMRAQDVISEAAAYPEYLWTASASARPSLPESEETRFGALRRPRQRSCFGREGGRAPPRWGGAHPSTHNSALRHRPRDTGVVLETEQGAALTARRDLKEAEVLPNRAHSAAPADVQTRSDLRQGPCRRSAGPVAIPASPQQVEHATPICVRCASRFGSSTAPRLLPFVRREATLCEP